MAGVLNMTGLSIRNNILVAIVTVMVYIGYGGA